MRKAQLGERSLALRIGVFALASAERIHHLSTFTSNPIPTKLTGAVKSYSRLWLVRGFSVGCWYS